MALNQKEQRHLLAVSNLYQPHAEFDHHLILILTATVVGGDHKVLQSASDAANDSAPFQILEEAGDNIVSSAVRHGLLPDIRIHLFDGGATYPEDEMNQRRHVIKISHLIATEEGCGPILGHVNDQK